MGLPRISSDRLDYLVIADNDSATTFHGMQIFISSRAPALIGPHYSTRETALMLHLVRSSTFHHD